MRAAAQHRWGKPSLAGRTVGVAGVGKVGSWLVDRLVEDGADVVVTDVDAGAVERVLARHPAVAADRLAEERMASVGRLAQIRLPR